MNLPTNSASNAFVSLCFLDDSSLMPNVYLNPAIFLKTKRNKQSKKHKSFALNLQFKNMLSKRRKKIHQFAPSACYIMLNESKQCVSFVKINIARMHMISNDKLYFSFTKQWNKQFVFRSSFEMFIEKFNNIYRNR